MNSFAVGTLVVMADGTSRPIEELKTGDLVLATDPLTGESSAEPVISPIVGYGTKRLIEVTADGSTNPIVATAEHPFWTQDSGWTFAKNLTAGDEVYAADQVEAPSTITSVTDRGWSMNRASTTCPSLQFTRST